MYTKSLFHFFFRERARRVNVLSLIFDFHDSNFVDVVDVLQHMTDFDEGIFISINGEEVFLCAFNHMYIGDMFQQQKNFDFKSQNVTLGCRFCSIINTDRDRLDYDFITNERFHHQNKLNDFQFFNQSKIFNFRNFQVVYEMILN